MATKKRTARAGKKATRKNASRKKAAARKKRPTSVFLRGFTGSIRQNADKTISIVGRGRRGRGGKGRK